MRRPAAGARLDALQRYLRPRRHSALLIAIVSAFAVRPVIGGGRVGPLLFSIALLLVLLLALYTFQIDELVGERSALLAERRRRRVVALVLAAMAVFERVAALFNASPSHLLVAAIAWFLFLTFVTWSQLRSLLRQRQVTGETISMAVSVYLLIGLSWALLYIVIHELQPGAFNLSSSASVADTQAVFPVFIYFSLTTLSTIGFGDIVPISLQARYLAVAEGITGQFYLAILVARLVSLQMSSGSPRDRS